MTSTGATNGAVAAGEPALDSAKDAASTVNSVIMALAEVDRWRAEEETRHQNELRDVDLEIQNLEAALQKVQAQLEAVRKYRADLAAKAETLDLGHVGRAYQLLFDVLGRQAAALEVRSQRVTELEVRRKASLPEMLASSEVGPLLTEYQQFKDETEPALAKLPESYRSVLLRHHQGVVNRLRDNLMRVLGAPVLVDDEELTVDVVYAVDAPEGKPELLVIVLPVLESTYLEWQQRGDNLALGLAIRVVQAVYEAAAACNFARAQVQAGGHQGLLVIEVDLEGADPSFLPQVASQFVSVFSAAGELSGAAVRVIPHEVKIDFVLPPEAEEEAADA